MAEDIGERGGVPGGGGAALVARGWPAAGARTGPSGSLLRLLLLPRSAGSRTVRALRIASVPWVGSPGRPSGVRGGLAGFCGPRLRTDVRAASLCGCVRVARAVCVCARAGTARGLRAPEQCPGLLIPGGRGWEGPRRSEPPLHLLAAQFPPSFSPSLDTFRGSDSLGAAGSPPAAAATPPACKVSGGLGSWQEPVQ